MTGDRVWIESAVGKIVAIVEEDPAVKPGVISMAHGWGRNPGAPQDEASEGSSTGLLISDESDYEPIYAQPRMSGIPVNISAYAMK